MIISHCLVTMNSSSSAAEDARSTTDVRPSRTISSRMATPAWDVDVPLAPLEQHAGFLNLEPVHRYMSAEKHFGFQQLPPEGIQSSLGSGPALFEEFPPTPFGEFRRGLFEEFRHGLFEEFQPLQSFHTFGSSDDTVKFSTSFSEEHRKICPRISPGDSRSRNLFEALTRSSRLPRLRSPNWSYQEKQALLKKKEEADHIGLGIGWGANWGCISQGLRDEYGFHRSPKCCEDQWGTLLKSFKPVQDHQLRFFASEVGLSYWDMDADARYENKLPRSFPREWYAAMKRIIAIKERRKREPQHRIRSRQQAVNASHLHPPDPITGCGSGHEHIGGASGTVDSGDSPWITGGKEGHVFNESAPIPGCESGQQIGGGSGMMDFGGIPWITDNQDDKINIGMAPITEIWGSCQQIGGVSVLMDSGDAPWITGNEADQIGTGLAPLVKLQVEDVVNSALDCLRPRKESILGATNEDADQVPLLSSYLKQLVQALVTSVIQDSESCKKKSTLDDDEWKQLIATEVSSAIEPIVSTLLAQKHEDRMYEREIHALAEKKRALALEEEKLLKRGPKRERVGNRRPTGAPRKKQQGSAMVIPTVQGLNITEPDANLS